MVAEQVGALLVVVGETASGKSALALELAKKFEQQAKSTGAIVRYEEVTSLKKSGELFEITTPHASYESEAVILAFGKTPNDLGAKGETKFKGKQIHYAALRNADDFKGKTVAIVGGANTAANAAIMLSGVAKKVYLLGRDAKMRCEQVLLDRLEKVKDIVEIHYSTQVQEFVGGENLDHVVVMVDGESRELAIDACFIGVGYSNKTEWVRELVATDKIGQIIIEPDCSTSTPGVFASGDVTTIPYKQVIISAGEGAKSAIAAHNYIAKKHGTIAANIDWGSLKNS